MPTFTYRSIRELEPRPGVKYATRYIKQTPQEYDRTRAWLISTAEQMIELADRDPQLAEWMCRPQTDFRRAQRGQYYSVQDLITDLVNQVALQRDLTQAMIDRWNRLCSGTPWEMSFVLASQEQTAARPESLFEFL